jgi:hypothetical protein
MSQTATVALIVAIIVAVLASALAFSLWRRTRLRALPEESRERYARSWRGVEAKFLDDPVAAVNDADRVVVMILSERGATLADPRSLPKNLIMAREAAASDRGQHGTEGMRVALVYYKRIVDDGVGAARLKSVGSRREIAS